MVPHDEAHKKGVCPTHAHTHTHTYTHTHTHLVQMWILADGRVHGVHLTVPRTIYVDSEVALDSAAAAGGASFSQATPGALVPLVSSARGVCGACVPSV